MMIRGLLSGELECTKEYAERLNKCTLCMACTEKCPAKTNIPNVIVAARADLALMKGAGFPYNIIFGWILPRRILFGNIVRFASWFQWLFLPKTEGTIRHLSMFLSAFGEKRNIPEISSKFLRQRVPVVNSPDGGVPAKLRVGYFSGCMTDFVFSDRGEKLIRFLNRNGVEVILPREQGCCGAPAFLGGGDFRIGRKLADANVKAFEGFDYVICDCATCGSAIREYPKFLADTPERKAAYEALANKIKDITEFCVDILKLPADRYQISPDVKEKTVTWHDPCHLNRYMNVNIQPRKILQFLPEIKYVEMKDAGTCCGMAGTFSAKFYELSKQIGDKKAKNIEESGADIVVTDCPGCQIQLTDAVIRNGIPVKVMHITELFM
jgi:glycolate oxidase iron-sulfur subunit